MVKIETGCTLKNLLCEQFKITPGYIADRVKTIFLNSKPVDDIETAIVKDQAVLAISAAMPGLVGAVFRSKGVLAAFRSSISYQAEKNDLEKSHNGMITLKFFNLLVKELGPAFLEKGILVTKSRMEEFLTAHKKNWSLFFKFAAKDGQEILLENIEDIINKLKCDHEKDMVCLSADI